MEKTPLILLPGTLCDEKLWFHQVLNLSDIADVRVGDLTRDSSIYDMAMRVLNGAPKQFALAGLSMGGLVALEIVKQAPHRVSKLALLDTNPLPPSAEQINNWKRFIDMANEGHFIEITQKYLLPLLIQSNNQSNTELVETIYQMAENVGKEAMIKQMTALQKKPDYTRELSNITCESLVIYGIKDKMVAPEIQKTLRDNIPNAHLKEIEDAGHLCSLEQPQTVTETLRYWLNDQKN
ncbi:alpha/beta fold hydrolase [Salimicrobium flavidum]|uniref:Pimeloyl-ACP methyl ester carboxylesterase n=1 Tax=Salimicrobium flavidum TaxID=570947 RepID=A0A1N7KQS9_9BACI|nr:alpha/beta hydrolase [Salimicrobium flavidum]SIS64002.1 Pimeloyl-ACP methyl ester carboxylesterase [Salimicrobium flavidum]